ncbi:MAG TPA: hypothetical protein VLC09_04405 [Polyangiaceae bacterium]|nr:hypothetical protein [Polyangiaceae bacterium]
MTEDSEREARAERRRSTYSGQVVRLGDPKPALYDQKTLLERLALQTSLVLRQAALSGHPPRKLPRAEWPGEVFDIGERNRRAR